MKMKKWKFDKKVYKIARILLGYCPICKTLAYDRRYKKAKQIASCNIYRTSKTSITMGCKQCGLNFTVTWKSLARAMGEKADELAKKYAIAVEFGQEAEYLKEDYMEFVTAIETLSKNVNIEGVLRNQ